MMIVLTAAFWSARSSQIDSDTLDVQARAEALQPRTQISSRSAGRAGRARQPAPRRCDRRRPSPCAASAAPPAATRSTSRRSPRSAAPRANRPIRGNSSAAQRRLWAERRRQRVASRQLRRLSRRPGRCPQVWPKRLLISFPLFVEKSLCLSALSGGEVMKLLSIFGTRPEAVKMAPVLLALDLELFVKSLVCVTGQHRALLDQVLAFFSIVPDFDLGAMKPGQGLNSLSPN